MSFIRLRSLIVFAIAAAALSCARGGVFERGPVICPLRACTGIPCGSCGLTRAVTAITCGQWIEATHLHLASLPLAAIALWALSLLFAEFITGQVLLGPIWNRLSGLMVWCILVLIASGWAVNLVVHFSHGQPH